jgi:5-formyltetrahydrofolate cyclo-ligase
VGYGGGFYDRFFPRTRGDALRAGVGFGIQLLGEALPGGPFDLRVDVVVTESETVRCRVDQ